MKGGKMTSLLSKEERTQVVNSHKRNLAMNQYNLQVSIIEENAKATKDSAAIQNLTETAAAIDLQIAALDAELASIAKEPDPA
jgi:hypothetical protein